MSLRMISWRNLAAVSVVALLGACAPAPSSPVASNPPPVAASAVWYHVNFDTNSFTIDAQAMSMTTLPTALRSAT